MPRSDQGHKHIFLFLELLKTNLAIIAIINNNISINFHPPPKKITKWGEWLNFRDIAIPKKGNYENFVIIVLKHDLKGREGDIPLNLIGQVETNESRWSYTVYNESRWSYTVCSPKPCRL